ncbi:hypothetical protein ACHAP5_006918 [Fusarium lateritium]
MSPRRSSRLQASVAKKMPTIEQQLLPKPSVSGTKRKATAIESQRKTKARKVLKTAETAVRETSKSFTNVSTANLKNRLLSLPAEIFDLVLENITDKTTLSRLSRTCKTFQSLLSPRLYSRVSVAVDFHGHIAKFIRNIEPHLSIKQRKQLKKEGKYRGQQDKYPSNLGPKEKPACAEYVRQLFVRHLNPGKKHAQILYRYIEEALHNMINIEILEFDTINEEIAESISRLEKLQALSICPNYEEEEFSKAESDSLKKIKNLKHLLLGGGDQFGTLQALLLNSGSTLKSLDMSPDASDFWERLEMAFKAGRHGTDRKPHLSALKSFTLSGSWFESTWITPGSIRSLGTVIGFIGLQELNITYLPDQVNLLYDHLAEVYSTAYGHGTGPHLRKLSMDMSFRNRFHTADQKQAIIVSQIRFLSSFNTLTSLHLNEYGKYSDENFTNPGLPDVMMQAILKHNNLERLGICYGGIGSREKIPYLSATAVATLVDGLPKLKFLDIAPEEDDTEALGHALSHSASLESIIFSHTPTWASPHCSDEPNMSLLEDLLKANLSKGDVTKARKYKWETHCKLRSVTIDEARFQIASKFRGGGKGIKKQQKFSLGSKPARQVMYRDVANAVPALPYEGFTTKGQWVDMVCADLD